MYSLYDRSHSRDFLHRVYQNLLNQASQVSYHLSRGKDLLNKVFDRAFGSQSIVSQQGEYAAYAHEFLIKLLLQVLQNLMD